MDTIEEVANYLRAHEEATRQILANASAVDYAATVGRLQAAVWIAAERIDSIVRMQKEKP